MKRFTYAIFAVLLCFLLLLNGCSDKNNEISDVILEPYKDTGTALKAEENNDRKAEQTDFKYLFPYRFSVGEYYVTVPVPESKEADTDHPDEYTGTSHGITVSLNVRKETEFSDYRNVILKGLEENDNIIDVQVQDTDTLSYITFSEKDDRYIYQDIRILKSERINDDYSLFIDVVVDNKNTDDVSSEVLKEVMSVIGIKRGAAD